MSMYVADPVVLQRVADLLRTLRIAIANSPAAGSQAERFQDLLSRTFDAELDLWCSDEATEDMELRATAAVELAATWVCLEMIEFQSAALLIRSAVEESWPDKVEVWCEHGREVAATIGRSSGDWGAALAYLHHYTGELLGGGGPA